MNYANIDEIKSVIFNDELTITEISNESGVLKTAIGKYRRGESAIENMSLSNAIKLQNYYLKLEEEKNMPDKMSREEVFGRAMGILDKISERHFEKGKPKAATKYLIDFDRMPMTVFYRAFKDIMEYSHQFDVIDLALVDRVNNYIGTMDPEDYNDNPLGPTHLIYISKEGVKIDNLIKNKQLLGGNALEEVYEEVLRRINEKEMSNDGIYIDFYKNAKEFGDLSGISLSEHLEARGYNDLTEQDEPFIILEDQNATDGNIYKQGDTADDIMRFMKSEPDYKNTLGMVNNMTKYAVTAHKTYETQYGMILEEPFKQIDAATPKKAEVAARKLFEEADYSSIYIDFAHPEEASCYYNPIHGHESSGVDWVSYLED